MGDESNQKGGKMGAGYVNLRKQMKRQQRKVGRGGEGFSLNRPELADFVLALRNTPVTSPILYLCDNQALLKAVKRWVSEGGKVTLVGAPDADILLAAIEELRKRATAGAATFLVKVKAHRAEPAKEEADIQADKAIQTKMFPRNGTTGQIEQFSHCKSLSRKEVRSAMEIDDRRGTAGCGRRVHKDQQKRRCASIGSCDRSLETDQKTKTTSRCKL